MKEEIGSNEDYEDEEVKIVVLKEVTMLNFVPRSGSSCRKALTFRN